MMAHAHRGLKMNTLENIQILIKQTKLTEEQVEIEFTTLYEVIIWRKHIKWLRKQDYTHTLTQYNTKTSHRRCLPAPYLSSPLPGTS